MYPLIPEFPIIRMGGILVLGQGVRDMYPLIPKKLTILELKLFGSHQIMVYDSPAPTLLICVYAQRLHGCLSAGVWPAYS